MTKTKDSEISLAIINTKIEYISDDIKSMRDQLDKLDEHERRITSVEGKVSAQAVFQTVFASVVAALAGFLGRRA